MRLKLKTLWHLRPRLLTLALVAFVGGMIVLANLTDEFGRRGPEVLVGQNQLRFSLADPARIDSNGVKGLWSLSYGWPLRWRQYLVEFLFSGPRVLGLSYSRGRFAANFAMWFVMLAAPAAASEWWLRRSRLGFHWSLRTMLVGVTLAAVFCGWFAAARNRADIQDAVIAAERSKLWVQHSGPRWLDLMANRYLRAVKGVSVDLSIDVITDQYEESFKAEEEFLAKLARLPELEYLFIEASDDPLPGLADALRKMRRLRVLHIDVRNSHGRGYFHAKRFAQRRRLADECVAAIGTLSDLEHLSLSDMPITGGSLAHLAALTKLKSLRLRGFYSDDENSRSPPLLSQLPVLPRLESVNLEDSYVGARGLRYLAVLPRLKTLNLMFTRTTDDDLSSLPESTSNAGLADLADIQSLEEISIAGELASLAGLESLLALKHLKRLHFLGPYLGESAIRGMVLDDGEQLEVLDDEADKYCHTLEALRQANPGIIIDGSLAEPDWPEEELVPDDYETIPDYTPRALVLANVRSWQTQIKTGVQAGGP